MKMKELSSRVNIPETTIRYYINDGIFIPESYTENYEGRKNYDFTENDVERLNQIAVLRKYGFTMKSIKQLSKCETDALSALRERIDDEKQSIKIQNDNVEKMEEALQMQPSSMKELCDVLNSPIIEKTPIPSIDEQSAYKPMYERVSKCTKIAYIILFALLILWVVGVVAFYHANNQGNVDNVQVVSVESQIHSQEEIESAIKAVKRYFSWHLRDCIMTEIEYAGDERTQDEAIYAEESVKNIIVLDSSFDVGLSGVDGSFEPNSTYGWSWVLKKEAGHWKVISYGYG